MIIAYRTSKEHWVFVVPTYAWRILRIVEEWILHTPFKDVEEVYFVMDCGGNIGNAGHYNQELCKEKGFSYKGTMEIIMPENYLAMFDTPKDGEAQNIIKQADPVIKKLLPISTSIYLFLICHYN